MNNAEPQQGELWLVKHEGVEQQAVRTKTDLWFFLSDHFAYLPDVGPIRRLAVVDPENWESAKRLAEIYTGQPSTTAFVLDVADELSAALREYANPKPKKPKEPTGLGAVVVDAEGALWVRTYGEANTDDYQCWKQEHLTTRHTWSEIDVVEILSEGVDTKSTT